LESSPQGQMERGHRDPARFGSSSGRNAKLSVASVASKLKSIPSIATPGKGILQAIVLFDKYAGHVNRYSREQVFETARTAFGANPCNFRPVSL